jgi:hypothetical protein
MTAAVIAQVMIAVFGVTAVFLSQDARESRRRWSSIFGLIGQPFWFWTTASAGQWGMFGLCFLYTFCYWRGLNQFWIRPWLDRRARRHWAFDIKPAGIDAPRKAWWRA